MLLSGALLGSRKEIIPQYRAGFWFDTQAHASAHIGICGGGCNAGDGPTDKQDGELFLSEALIWGRPFPTGTGQETGRLIAAAAAAALGVGQDQEMAITEFRQPLVGRFVEEVVDVGEPGRIVFVPQAVVATIGRDSALGGNTGAGEGHHVAGGGD